MTPRNSSLNTGPTATRHATSTRSCRCCPKPSPRDAARLLYLAASEHGHNQPDGSPSGRRCRDNLQGSYRSLCSASRERLRCLRSCLERLACQDAEPQCLETWPQLGSPAPQIAPEQCTFTCLASGCSFTGPTVRVEHKPAATAAQASDCVMIRRACVAFAATCSASNTDSLRTSQKARDVKNAYCLNAPHRFRWAQTATGGGQDKAWNVVRHSGLGPDRLQHEHTLSRPARPYVLCKTTFLSTFLDHCDLKQGVKQIPGPRWGF